MSFTIAYIANKCDDTSHKPSYWVGFYLTDLAAAVTLIAIGALLQSNVPLCAGLLITGGAIALFSCLSAAFMGLQKLKDIIS